MKTNDIEKKREEIDKIDRLLVDLLINRFNLSKEISNLKKGESLDNYDPKREDIIFENIKKLLDSNGSNDKISHIRSIYQTLLKESKSYQSEDLKK